MIFPCFLFFIAFKSLPSHDVCPTALTNRAGTAIKTAAIVDSNHRKKVAKSTLRQSNYKPLIMNDNHDAMQKSLFRSPKEALSGGEIGSFAIRNRLFGRLKEALSQTGGDALGMRGRLFELHNILSLTCEMGLKDSKHDFGGLSSKVDALCRRHGLSVKDTIAIQRMRHHCSSSEAVSAAEFAADCRSLCRFMSVVADVPIPQDLAALLPKETDEVAKKHRRRRDCIRCTLQRWDDVSMTVMPCDGNAADLLRVYYHSPTQEQAHDYLKPILWQGMQLNLIDCKEHDGGIVADILIVEPDYLVDISTLANCFETFGHSPFLYILNRLKERPNTKHTLLGNFAGTALDMVIDDDGATMADILRANFREKAVEYATCEDFTAQTFKQEAARQVGNIRQIVSEMFVQTPREMAVLEPSFVCERLGISGRADLMTTDMRLLVEQKAGKNIFIEWDRNNAYGGKHIEKHYVQLLLYHAMLVHNFGLKSRYTDIRLLYSRYQLPEGLVEVASLKKLTTEALRLRNLIVATEYAIADKGFSIVLPHLHSEVMNANGCQDSFFERYQRPQIDALTTPLHSLTPLERAYYCRMTTFVEKEMLMSKVGGRAGMGMSVADLWNMPLSEKVETGNIYVRLALISVDKSHGSGAYDRLSFRVGELDETFIPNFRRGDMVYVYSYRDDAEPDVRRSMLFKGVIAELSDDRIEVQLNDGQHNKEMFTARQDGGENTLFAIEHAGSDVGATAAMRALYTLMTASEERKSLLLAQRVPRADKAKSLSKNYDADLDDILLRAKQATDYFLLVGPPGTGKTSVALRHIVEEHLSDSEQNRLLLTAYTNRAVDEICAMLRCAEIDFLRMGNYHSCDPLYRDNLIATMAENSIRLDDIKQRMMATRVFVATTATLAARPFLLSLLRFSLAIVDEAGQLAEPSIVGLLAAHDDTAARRSRIDKFILVGDYKQLPAVVRQSGREAAVDGPLLQTIGLRNCGESLFERLIRWERKQGRTDFVGVLRRQGRMHPDVAEFPNSMFYQDEKLIPVPCQHQIDTSIGYEEPSHDDMDELLKRHRVLFIPSTPCREEASSDKVNTSEASIVADLLCRIRRLLGSAFDTEKSVGIIVPYRNQIAMIRREIAKRGMADLGRICIDTVERYQGSQRDVIIYSFTVHERYQLDFLAANRTEDNGRIIDRKLNVALTRARKQMIVTGNPSLLKQDPIFHQFLSFVESKHGVIAPQT